MSNKCVVSVTIPLNDNPITTVRVFNEEYEGQKFISSTWISTKELEGLSKKPLLAKFGEYREGEIIEVDFELY